MLESVTLALVVAAGFAAGVASGLFGIGGGVLMVPALLALLPGTPFHDAKAASLLVTVASAAIGAWTHHRRGSVDWRRVAPLLAGGAVGTVVALLAVEEVADATLRALFGLVLAAMGAHLALGRAPRPRDLAPRTERIVLATLGALGGVLAGAFGVGGGIAMVPGMVLAGVGMHLAVGTSLVVVVANASLATGLHAALGYGWALLALGLPLAVGGVPGARVGSVLAHRIDADRLRRAFGVALALIGLLMAADVVIRM